MNNTRLTAIDPVAGPGGETWDVIGTDVDETLAMVYIGDVYALRVVEELAAKPAPAADAGRARWAPTEPDGLWPLIR